MKKMLVCFCLMLVLISCAKKEEGKVIAVIDDEKITVEEFNRDLDRIPTDMKMLVVTQSGKRNYLDKMIVKRLLLKEAAKEKIESSKEFQDRLGDIKDQLIIESLLKKKISDDATKITEENLKKFYDDHREEFKRDREINTRHILVKNEEEARQILERLQKGEDFVELARSYSIDPHAGATGGELGYYPKGTLMPEYENAAFKLTKAGQISGIVKTKFGFHIIRLEGIKKPSYVPFEEVKDFIRQKISQERQTEVFEGYIDTLKKNAKITINEEMIKEEKPLSPDKQEQPEKQAEKPVAPVEKQETPAKK